MSTTQHDIFDLTGLYVRTVSCADIDQQLAEGETAVASDGYPPNQKLLVDAEVVLLPPQPSIFHRADPGTQQWVDTRSLEQLKAMKWTEMKRARMAAVEQPLVTPYGTFDADAASRANIADATQAVQTQAQNLAGGESPTIDFTLADNTDVTLTAAQMIEVALLLSNQVQAAYARGRQVRAAIDAATAAADVAAITWETTP